MAQSVITSAFERLKAQEAAGGNRIIIDQFIFANLPGQDADATPSPDETIPAAEHIVHTQQVDKNGMVNENTVAYSVTLPESAGNFTFNWLGLVSSATNTLCMVVYLHPQEKIKTADGIQGNVLVYSEIMEYAGASVATGITTPVSTWQIDFTARLHGMDEATRKAALDIYGPGVFFDDAFKLTASGTGQATFAPGIAYLRGLRVELETSGTLTFPTGVIQTVYLDAALTGTLTGENKATFSLTSKMTADYTDSSGFSHYVEPVATISASGLITDIRKTRRPLHKRLEGEFLTRGANLSDVQDKARSRESLEVYSKTESDKSYLAKDQNGADVPDKPAFLQNVGAFPVTGGRLNGPLGIGTDNVLGGNSIVLGDNDTGIKWISDGILGLYANGTQVGYIDPAGLHLNSEGLHVGGARMSSDGNVWGTRWNASGQWLWDAIVEQLNTRGTIDWINSQLSERDNNINARAPRNTASLAVNGWFRDASTGWIFQWGITPFAGNTTITVSLPIPFPVQGFLALGGPASALWYGEDDNSSYAALLNNSQLQVTTDTNVGTAWIVMGH
ncbi:phage tail protein [Salmonella enterica]|nr:phage tail protein [Salmonella enterica]EJF5918160.1 phage tail protein [Salmonella enterica]EJF5940863.1 phage tail protein [Salmonella enterica]